MKWIKYSLDDSPGRYDVGEEGNTFVVFFSVPELVQVLHDPEGSQVLPGVGLQLYHVVVEQPGQDQNDDSIK